MCAIIGAASTNKIDDISWVSNGLDVMNHRGPDMYGMWNSIDQDVVLGHNRLSIIDLSENGQQPMVFDNSIYLVLNGEIYNYKELKEILHREGFVFKSNSDTEVLLYCYVKWGFDCLDKINGMFSFAIYDKNIRKIFLARDRAGEKPLYYYHKNKTIQFSSEIKGLLADKKIPREIDHSSLKSFLSIGYTTGSSSIFSNIEKVEPGCFLIFDLESGKIQANQYWNFPKQKRKKNQKDYNILLNEFEAIFQNAVSKQLVSDVPLGILLSGGLDSSLITAMASRSVKNIKTFTVKFSKSKSFDESLHAKLISEFYGTEHYELEAGNIDKDIFQKLSKQFDEPIIDLSMIPTSLVCSLVKDQCTVALGGDGGDELFGGYNYYRRSAFLKFYFSWISKYLRIPLSKIISRLLHHDSKGMNWIQYFGKDFIEDIDLVLRKFDHYQMNTLFKNLFKDQYILNENFLIIDKKDNDLQSTLTKMDFKNFLPNDILVKTDRASMMHSLEVRAPFLDKNMIEFAYKEVPSDAKFSHKNTKIFLKDFAKKILPPNFDFNRKQGFEFPLHDLLTSGPIRNFFEEVLKDNQCVFKETTVKKLFSSLDSGFNVEDKLFTLLQFELWRENFSVKL